jgi:hypothetical protein
MFMFKKITNYRYFPQSLQVNAEIHSFRNLSRHAHSRFQSEFYTDCDLVLPLSLSSILSFP